MTENRPDRSFLGTGWAFPVRLAEDGTVALADHEEDVRQAIRIILETNLGERVMRPEFGSGLRQFVFESVSTTTLSVLRHRVEEALVRWEPRIDVEAVGVELAPGTRRPGRRLGRLHRAGDEHVLQPRLPLLPRRGRGRRGRRRRRPGQGGCRMSPRPAVTAPRQRREAADVVADYLRRSAGYVPRWLPGVDNPAAAATTGDPALGVVRAEAAMLASLWERLDRVPDKHELAFLSELGIDALPPAAARTPVAFEAMPLGVDGVVPEGALVGADGEDGQVTFRTEHAVAVTASRLAEVRSVVVAADTVGDHSVEAVGQRPFTLFSAQRSTERCLYIGHDHLLAIRGRATISIEVELAQDARVPLTVEWSVWDGSTWRIYQGEVDGAPAVSDQTDTGTADAPHAFGQSGVVSLRSTCVESARKSVDGTEAFWVRARLVSPLALVEPLALPRIDQIRLAVEIGSPVAPVAYPVGSALALGQSVDPSTPFHPFGQAPDRTSVFYADATEALAARTRRATFSGVAETDDTTTNPKLQAEFWDGRSWRPLAAPVALAVNDAADDGTEPTDPVTGETPPPTPPTRFAVAFDVPQTWTASEVEGTKGTWLRLRLARGETYLGSRDLGPESDPIPVPTFYPVRFSDLSFTVYGRSAAAPADHVLVDDGAGSTDHTTAARWRGEPFAPFRPRPDRADALYLGFDGPLPAGTLGLYVDVEADPQREGGPPEHELRWERFDGVRWVSLPVEDETRQLTGCGVVRLLWPGNRPVRSVRPVAATGRTATTQRTADAHRFVPGDVVHLHEGEVGEIATVASVDRAVVTFAKPLANAFRNAGMSEPEPPLFGTPRTWVRARLAEGSPRPSVVVRRIVPNVAWASEQRRVARQRLGEGTGQPNQRLFSTDRPLLPGVLVEIRELSGARARTDRPILERELAGTGRPVVVEPGPGGAVTEVWVGWEARGTLASSGPTDRHVVVDLVSGVLRFGDDRHGRSLPTGAAVRLTADVGGGARGNLPAGAVTNPLSGIVVASVTNLVAASGGADAESAALALARAPGVVRHRYQAVTAEDYRAVALEASPEVFDATVVASPDDLGGRLRVHVLPASGAEDPTPSDQLLARVERHLRRRCPVGAAELVDVLPPRFTRIGVAVTVAALPGRADEVYDRVRAALRAFLHPVTGGPSGATSTEPLTAGWPFGASIHTARFGRLLEGVEGVDHVESLTVTRDGAFVGDVVELDLDALPLAGSFEVRLVAPEGAR